MIQDYLNYYMNFEMHRGKDIISQAELHDNREFTTIKDINTTKPKNYKNVLDNYHESQLEMSDFSMDQD